ncbi:MAG: cell division protein SepF [Clostridiales bacterium]|nr:cell division protein SepF [Clostridiales bacterium]
MGFMDKLKNMARFSDEDYFNPDDRNIDDYENDYEDDGRDLYSDSSYEKHAPVRRPVMQAERPISQPSGNVVDLHTASSRPNVVFKKVDKYEEVGEVADVLNRKCIVILNLETCPNDTSRRVLDFLYGVAYANNGEIKRVAGRAYIITPYNVPVTGELLDEISGSSDVSDY